MRSVTAVVLSLSLFVTSQAARRMQFSQSTMRAQCTGLYSGKGGERERYLINEVSKMGWGATEVAQFMAQCAHECGGFYIMKERASGNAYNGRRSLGNIYPGDGPRYKGRGFIQITGRYNYRKYGKLLGIDLENNPELAERPEIAAKVAIQFWKLAVKPRVRDFSDTSAVTKRINGGYNGLADRRKRFAQYRPKCGAGGGSSGGSGGSSGEGAICKWNKGVCVDVSKGTCKAATLSGLCRGGNNIKCCPSSQRGVGSPCSGVAGVCIDTSVMRCPRSTLSGKCSGGNSVRCCPGF